MVNLLESSLGIAPSFITSMTTSVSEPPIWKPTLPPSTLTPAGADQPPPDLRQTMKPRPYLAPTMKAPFLTPGITTTQAALASKSCGIPLSGVPIISPKTLAEGSRRFSVSVAGDELPRVLANTGPEMTADANERIMLSSNHFLRSTVNLLKMTSFTFRGLTPGGARGILLSSSEQSSDAGTAVSLGLKVQREQARDPRWE